jgi:PAS domain-containing protein
VTDRRSVLYDEAVFFVYVFPRMPHTNESMSEAPADAGSAWMNNQNLVSILMQHLPACIFVKNTTGSYISANQSMAAMLGFASADALVGKTDYDIFTPEKARAQSSR